MSQTLRRLYRVTNPNGLHMRPLQAFVGEAMKYPGEVQVCRTNGGEMINGKSMISLLSLAAERGMEIAVIVTGPDPEALADKLVEALDRPYDD